VGGLIPEIAVNVGVERFHLKAGDVLAEAHDRGVRSLGLVEQGVEVHRALGEVGGQPTDAEPRQRAGFVPSLRRLRIPQELGHVVGGLEENAVEIAHGQLAQKTGKTSALARSRRARARTTARSSWTARATANIRPIATVAALSGGGGASSPTLTARSSP
jgi:hypothetical protein